MLYETEEGKTRVECRFVEDTLWLTQALMAVYSDGELQPEATIRKFLIVRQEGSRQVSRNSDHYNLDAILAVGYRVRSTRGTQFRRWATERLREYRVKGFTLDDQRLKNPSVAEQGDRIIAMNCWNAFAIFGLANGSCIYECGRFLRWRPIIRKQRSFST